jgi:arylsulfatase A-like enzyme
LDYLPWPQITTVTSAGVLTCAWIWASRRWRWLHKLELAGLPLVFVTCAVSLLTVDASNETGRRGLDDTLGGSLAYDVALATLDFDRDGYLNILGGGDCAPFDSKRGPGAVDIPNNGLDEDCDGVDLDAKQLAVKVKRDYPVPKEFPRRPSILLVTVDAFAASRMSALGNKRVVTPQLDAFAARSTLFRYCFSQGPSTRLSFPSIFTSRWDSQIEQRLVGKHPFPIEDSEQLLAEVLSAEGYDTAAVVSDGYFRRNRWASLTRGFAELIDSPALNIGRHNSVQVTDAALRVLRRQRERPLFLWVHYYDAHPPQVQPEGIERFGDSRADIYDAELRLVDREAGRLLAQATAAADGGPLIFVTGDHGIAFDPPRHTKFNYGYDLSSIVLHVPLIVHGPMVKTQAFDELVSTMDVAPTIANLVRIQKPLRFEGASLLPELLEGKASRPQRLVHEMFIEERLYRETDPLELISLRTEHYNLIHDRRRGSFELYAWRNDYHETRNLADEPSYQSTLRGLKQQLALFTYELYGRDPNRTAQVAPSPPRPIGPQAPP